MCIENMPRFVNSWDEQDRLHFQVGDRYSPLCALGCWDCDIDRTLKHDLKGLVSKKRNNGFYYPTTKGMSLERAKIIVEEKEANKKFRITICGLVATLLISALTLVVSVLVYLKG